MIGMQMSTASLLTAVTMQSKPSRKESDAPVLAKSSVVPTVLKNLPKISNLKGLSANSLLQDDFSVVRV